MNNFTFRCAAFAVFALLLAGCGGDGADERSAADEAPPAANEDAGSALPSAGRSAAPDEPAFVLTPADVDAYEQGVRREIDVLRSARERYRQAEDDEAQLEILGEIQPRELRREGAAAAGMAEDRYARVTSAVNDVFGKLEMTAASQQMMPNAGELEGLSPEQRAQVEENLRQMQAAWGDPYAGLSADATAALQRRADALARLRAEHIGLLVPPR